MKAWKTKVFWRWQKKEALSDQMLAFALSEIKAGLIDADLGDGLIKKRVSRPGFGKRSGYRILLATNKHEKWFFVYGFAKNEQENIHHKELAALKELSTDLLNLSHTEIQQAIKNDALREVAIYAK